MGSITDLDRGLMDHASAEAIAAEASFRELFTSTYPSLVAYARRRCPDHVEADDVVAEAYTIAWRRRADYRPAGADSAGADSAGADSAGADSAGADSALPWLYGIAANVLRNTRRAGSRRLQLVERLQAQPPASSDDEAGTGTPGAEIRQALERLSYDDREVLRLVAWEGLSHAEAGQALDCTPNAVGIRLHRARQRLQSELAASRSGTDRPHPPSGNTGNGASNRPGPSNTTEKRRGGATS